MAGTLYVYDGRLALDDVMIRLNHVRLALPDAEAEWWRNAAPVAVGGTGLDLAPADEWAGPTAVAGSSAAVTVMEGSDWEVGPMQLAYDNNVWAWDVVWVVPLSQVLAEEARMYGGTNHNNSTTTTTSSTPETDDTQTQPDAAWERWPLAELVGPGVDKVRKRCLLARSGRRGPPAGFGG